MPRKGYSLVGATLPEEWESKFTELCKKTNETKVDFMKRIITNELAIIDGKEEDVRFAFDNSIQKKLDIIIAKMDKNKIDLLNNSSQLIGIKGAIMYLIKVSLRSIYLLVGHMHITNRMDKNEYTSFRSSAEKKAQQEFYTCMSAVETNDNQVISEILLSNKQE